MESKDPLEGYPVPCERHKITEQRKHRESHAWYPRRCERDKGGAAGGGEVVHACGVQKLIAAIVKLVGGVTGRSTWYRG
jgi:hypothetical protein